MQRLLLLQLPVQEALHVRFAKQLQKDVVFAALRRLRVHGQGLVPIDALQKVRLLPRFRLLRLGFAMRVRRRRLQPGGIHKT